MIKILSIFLLFTLHFLFWSCASRDIRGGRYERIYELKNREYISRTVEAIDEAGLKNLIQERNGKILILNIWATWCMPCIEEIPDLARLSRSYKYKNIEVIGISADYTDETESKIIPFLKKKNVPFKVYVAKFDHQEDFINALDTSWNGAIPATFIYDSSGKKRSFLIGKQSYSQFKTEIKNAGYNSIAASR